MSFSDPPSARHRRGKTSPQRRATTNSHLQHRERDHKPANTRLGALVTVVIALLFLAYVFNLGGFAAGADGFFSNLDASAKSQNSTVVAATTSALPVVALLFAALMLFVIVRAIFRGAKNVGKQRRLAGRDHVTLDHFKHITAESGIRPRIATQGYLLLLPFYQSSMRARMDDRLCEDLHMTSAQVQDALANLLRNTDRKARVGGPEDPIHTVLDLLRTVQDSARQSLMNSVVRSVAPGRTAALKSSRSGREDVGEPR